MGRSVANAYGESWEKDIEGCKSWWRIVVIIMRNASHRSRNQRKHELTTRLEHLGVGDRYIHHPYHYMAIQARQYSPRATTPTLEYEWAW